MLTILYGVIGFTITIIVLVVILLVAKSRLVASGDVTININDGGELTGSVTNGEGQSVTPIAP